ncbi:S-layer homology domain-containing protein [Salisediminibacterium selenitireducens]|uniref:S-layer domain protein n=1 Tax=Bacillus selenitireducens (strain ATCC 700615 / DSM 15326 / MLS10) TaxID=439292 RepID=D6XZG5_BACIE|nr:S-layer homology domain-containing protein [Salisediminibacterium selenitireducens]ADH98339.1 S-layer domain protein [[Bacillus] selenitireducens MLS10]
MDNAEELYFNISNEEGEDASPPTVADVQVDTSETYYGERIAVSLVAEDDLSGVRSVSVFFRTPSDSRSESVRLNYDEETDRWKGYYTVPEYAASGKYPLDFISTADHAGNSIFYYPRDVDNADDLYFNIIASLPPLPDIDPVPGTFTLDNETWTSKTIDGDLYVGPESILSIDGDVQINGDVYVFGAIRSFGGLNVTGTMNVRSANFSAFSFSPVSQGSLNVISGSNHFGTLRATNARWDIPFRLDHESFEVKDGSLLVEGAMIPVGDLYINDQQVDFYRNGVFEETLTDIEGDELAFRIIDVFGNKRTFSEPLTYYGVPYWLEDSELEVTEVSDIEASLKWGTTVDPEETDSFRIYLNDTLVSDVGDDSHSYTLTGLEPMTEYDVQVVATSIYGKESKPLKVSFKTEPDEEMIKEWDRLIKTAEEAIGLLPERNQISRSDREQIKEARDAVDQALEADLTAADIEGLSLLSDAEERLVELDDMLEDVIRTIAGLKDITQLTPADAEDIHAARETVEKAKEAGIDSAEIANYDRLTAAEDLLEKLKDLLQAANTKINDLPELRELTLSDAEQIKNTREAVNEALSQGYDESDLENLIHLEEGEKRLIKLNELLEQAELRIGHLPDGEDLLPGHEEEIEAARKAVERAKEEGISPESISNLHILTQAEEVMKAFTEKLTVLQEALHSVPDLADVTADHAPLIADVQNQVDAIASEPVLEEEKKRLDHFLEVKERLQLLVTLEEMISALPPVDEISVKDDESLIDETVAEVNGVVDSGVRKESILSYDSLMTVEKRYADLKKAVFDAEAAISGLPAPDDLTLEHQNQLEEARNKTDQVKELSKYGLESVYHYAELAVLEERMAILKSLEHSPFRDVVSSNRFAEDIYYLTHREVISGFPDGSFHPDRTVTRAQAAIMIGRALGFDGEQRDNQFADVSTSMQASGFIQAAADVGIIQGFPDETFRPDDTVTRGQMAIFLARAFDLQDDGSSNITFTDMSSSMQAYHAVHAIYTKDITQGFPDGTYRPDEGVTRGQFSAFLTRALQ